MQQASPHIFVSYAHQDAAWLARLQVHLKPLVRSGEIELWDDTRLAPGVTWRQELRHAISAARVAVLLVSADFLASDFVHNDELPPLLDKAAQGGTRILSLIVGPCMFKKHPALSNYQSINPPDKPLTSMSSNDAEDTLVRLATHISTLASVAGPPTGPLVLEPSATRRDSTVEARGRNMRSHVRQLIDEFLAANWTSYGLADLERLVRRDRYAATPEALDNIDLLSRLLFDLQMYDRGKAHLENWLEANPESEHAPRFRLRLVLYLHEMNEPQAALNHVEILQAHVNDSPPLICLKGNLMNKCGKPRDQIIGTFEEAIGKAPQWAEPKAELLEQLILTDDLARAQRHAEEYLRREGLTLRERTGISALRVVARFCQYPNCWETPEFQAELASLKATVIPNSQRETWRFDRICDKLITMGVADVTIKAAAFGMRDWLKALEPVFKKE